MKQNRVSFIKRLHLESSAFVLAITSIVLTNFALVSCTNYTEEDDFKEWTNSYITFVPMEIKTIGATTRGELTTNSKLTEYGVSASIYPASQSYTSAGCGSYWFNQSVDAALGKTDRYWPGEKYKVSFFAYAPVGLAALTPLSKEELGYPIYSYTVPSEIAKQVDFMTADVLDHSWGGVTEPVPLEFKHECTDIRFKIYNQGSENITVHSIAVNGVKYSGTNKGGVWTLNSAVNSTTENPFILTLNTVVSGETTIDATGDTNHFIMLPQTVMSGTAIFDVDATVGGKRQHFFHELKSDLVLQKGRSYLFKITLGEQKIEVDTDTDIKDWEMEIKYLSVDGVNANDNWNQPDINNGENIGINDWEKEE